MSFETITLTWKDEEFSVAPKNVMGLISVIENHVTLMQLTDPMTIKNTQIATAYCSALTYAGARCDVEEVYSALFSEEGQKIKDVLRVLIQIMVPPDTVKTTTKKPKKPTAKRKKSAS